MIIDSNKNILDRNNLVLLRERRLREFLINWFTRYPDSRKIIIEERTLNSEKIVFHEQVTITFPLNQNEFDTNTLIDYTIQQLFETITDIPWNEDICDFEYTDVILFNFSDYSSLYPSTITYTYKHEL